MGAPVSLEAKTSTVDDLLKRMTPEEIVVRSYFLERLLLVMVSEPGTSNPLGRRIDASDLHDTRGRYLANPEVDEHLRDMAFEVAWSEQFLVPGNKLVTL
jgi:hypothetical protein